MSFVSFVLEETPVYPGVDCRRTALFVLHTLMPDSLRISISLAIIKSK